MAVNIPLKTAILASGKKQKRIAKLAKMTEPRLSQIVRNRRPASDDEQQTLSRVLARPIDELFHGAA